MKPLGMIMAAGTGGESLLIRRARREEAALLGSIAAQSKAHWGYDATTLEQWQAQLTIAPDDIDANPVFVAELDGVIAGFYLLVGEHPEWTLEHLWILPAWHGRGVGTLLLRHAQGLVLKGFDSRISVASDPHAVGFYERSGGVRTGSRPAPLPGLPDRVLPLLEFRNHTQA